MFSTTQQHWILKRWPASGVTPFVWTLGKTWLRFSLSLSLKSEQEEKSSGGQEQSRTALFHSSTRVFERAWSQTRSSFSGSFSCWQLKLSEVECNTHTIHSLQPDGHHMTASGSSSTLWRWIMKQSKHTRTWSSSLKNNGELDHIKLHHKDCWHTMTGFSRELARIALAVKLGVAVGHSKGEG